MISETPILGNEISRSQGYDTGGASTPDGIGKANGVGILLAGDASGNLIGGYENAAANSIHDNAAKGSTFTRAPVTRSSAIRSSYQGQLNAKYTLEVFAGIFEPIAVQADTDGDGVPDSEENDESPGSADNASIASLADVADPGESIMLASAPGTTMSEKTIAVSPNGARFS